MEEVILPKWIAKEGDDHMNSLREKAYKKAMTGPVKSLLGLARDAKTIKSLKKKNVLTGVLYLAPGDVSGKELCHSRTKGCSKGCLFTAGHGTYSQIKVGRLRKTYQFLFRQEDFLGTLVNDIEFLLRKAERDENIPAVRLNGTSDIPWENYPVTRAGERSNNVFEAFPELQFYDYTKHKERIGLSIPNYHLTFSYAETKANRQAASKAVEAGMNVAVVFKSELPKTFTIGDTELKVIDGDETDVRFWDEQEEVCVVGLSAKGQANKDDTGFVIR